MSTEKFLCPVKLSFDFFSIATVCPPPKLPQYSYVRSPSWFNTSGGAGNGRRLYLACSPGYNKVGGSFLMCSGDRWQLPTSIKCLRKYANDQLFLPLVIYMGCHIDILFQRLVVGIQAHQSMVERVL